MRATRDEDTPQGAKFRCFGVMKLVRVSYGKKSHWGGMCGRHSFDPELLAQLPVERDYWNQVRLKVILNVHPKRAKRLGFGTVGINESVLVNVYSINAAKATVFAELVKYLPDGNPWTLGVGYEHPWLTEY